MPSVPTSGSSPPPPPAWDTRPATPGQVAYGGFWIRLAAYIIDAVVLSFVTVVLAEVSDMSLFETEPEHYGTINFISFIIGWLYFALMESSPRGATLGKMAVGLRVMTSDGQRLSFMNATGRYFAKIVSALILGIGFLMIAFGGTALHDRMAGTRVVYRGRG